MNIKKKKKNIDLHVSCRPGRVTANQHIFLSLALIAKYLEKCSC